MSITGPAIYELNTWAWLNELSARYGRPVTLSDVPPSEWDCLAELRCDFVWLMGVWQRSPTGRQIALQLPDLVREYGRALPDWTAADVSGSPYCVQQYAVDSRLGSVSIARRQLARRGMKLLLDFVPNHVARDHLWVKQHPEYFIQGNQASLARSPDLYFSAGDAVIAHGRDPYFPPWTDVAQLNAFSAALRGAAIATLKVIATQCDGVRCDMAMLLLTDVFQKTWGAAAGSPLSTEYWLDVISSVRRNWPEFLFVAEAYWDREWDLQQLGFDYCYDKRLYDRLVHEGARPVRDHLGADLSYQARLIRFLENHDEPRAASSMPLERHRAAAIAIGTLPGAILYHRGQFSGAQVRLPVQLGRAPVEPPDTRLQSFYAAVRAASAAVKTADAQWHQHVVTVGDGAYNTEALLAWTWEHADTMYLTLINFGGAEAAGFIPLAVNVDSMEFRELVATERIDGQQIRQLTHGIGVRLKPWQAGVLRFAPVGAVS